MSGRRKILAGAGMLGVLAVGAWLLFAHTGEPRYQGKPVSYWFNVYCQSGGDDENARAAFAAMGTNALPYLLRMAFTHDADPVPRKILMDVFRRLPEAMKPPRIESNEEIQHEAIFLVEKLPLTAAQLLPLVQTQLTHTNSFQYRVAIELLGDTEGESKQLIPVFAKALHNPSTQKMVLRVTKRLGPQAGALVPDLMELIQNEALRTTFGNTDLKWTLGKIGSNATAAVPLLKHAFEHETNAFLNIKNAAVLYKIDPAHPAALTFLTNSLLVTNDDSLAQEAAIGLAYIGPAARPAAPALLSAWETTNADLQDKVLRALVAIDAPKDLVEARVRENFGSKDDEIRESAAEFVLEREPGDREAQAVLIDAITNHSDYEESAIEALGKAGPAARSQIPAILDAFSVKGYHKWRGAPEALAAMRAPPELAIARLNDAIGADLKAHSDNTWAYTEMADDLLKLSPANRNAQLELLLWVEHNAWVIHHLTNANPPIPEVKAGLRSALTNANAKIRSEAAAALKKIEAREDGKK